MSRAENKQHFHLKQSKVGVICKSAASVERYRGAVSGRMVKAVRIAKQTSGRKVIRSEGECIDGIDG